MKTLKNTITLVALFAFLFNYGQKNNPMDYVGKLHNKDLEKIYAHLTAMKNIKTKKDAVKEIINFMNKKDNLKKESFNYLYSFVVVHSKQDFQIKYR